MIAPVPNVQTGSSAERIACWVVLGVDHKIDRPISDASDPTVRARTVMKIHLKLSGKGIAADGAGADRAGVADSGAEGVGSVAGIWKEGAASDRIASSFGVKVSGRTICGSKFGCAGTTAGARFPPCGYRSRLAGLDGCDSTSPTISAALAAKSLTAFPVTYPVTAISG